MKYFSDRDLKNTYSYAVRVMISAPVIVRPGEVFSANISLLKTNGYPDFEYSGELIVSGGKGIKNLPDKIYFSGDEEANQIVNNLEINDEGLYRFNIKKSEENIFPAGISNTIWCTSQFPYKLYFGDMHVHSELGKCQTPFMPKSPDFGYWYAKHIAGHDFCSITDHSVTTREDWKQTKEAATIWNSPGEFVSILGYEGDYDGEDGGHFNIYFREEDGDNKSFKLNDGGTLENMFEFVRENNAICIGHHSGRYTRGRDFSKSKFGGKAIEPCAEVISQWGSSETRNSTRPVRMFAHPDDSHYYKYAVGKGFRLGALGGSDSHATTPGGFAPMVFPHRSGKTIFEYPGAITGIFAESLSRENLFEALTERRCFASANDRALVWLSGNGGDMGAEIVTQKDIVDIIVIGCTSPIREVNVIRNGEEYMKFGALGIEEGFDDTGFLFKKTIDNGRLDKSVSYYIRAIQQDGDIIISSPMWLDPK